MTDASALDLGPIHPGEILDLDFLEPMGISQSRLSKSIGVAPRRVNEIVHGKRGITADTAERFGLFFGMEARFWMNLQAQYDLELLRSERGEELRSSVVPWKRSA
jgi:addiction module HigA family antidote